MPKSQPLRYCFSPCKEHALTSMDGGNADFAGAKICQSNALILTFGHRQNL